MASIKSNLENIHQSVERAEPETYEALCTAVNAYMPKTWGWSAVTVHYMGFYQGIRLRVHDASGTEHNLPGKTSCYSMRKPTDADLTSIAVNNTGKEI